MRIEVLVDGSVEPQIYPLNKPSVSLGSGESCDVIISSTNISRKHLIIITDGDSFYVVDQGSTNGTYINEQRLVPGRRVEFTSFFPVRLGDDVLVSLLSDDDVSAGDDEAPLIPVPGESSKGRDAGESTKMISLADLKKAKTSDLQAKRSEVIAKKKTVTKKPPLKKTKRTQENQNFKLLSFLVLGVVAAIGYYNIQNKKEESALARVGEIVPKDPVVNTAPAEPAVNPSNQKKPLIPESEFYPKEKYSTLLGDLKCVTDIEKYFCEKIPGANDGKHGVVQIGTTMHIMIDGDPYIKEAREYVVHPAPDAEGKYPPEIYEPYKKVVMNTALALFWMKGFPADMDIEKIKDLKMSVVIFETWEGVTYTQRVAVAHPENIVALRKFLELSHIQNVKKIGEEAIKFTNDYYQTY